MSAISLLSCHGDDRIISTDAMQTWHARFGHYRVTGPAGAPRSRWLGSLVLSRHPVTPMIQADLRPHPGRRTDRAAVHLPDTRTGLAAA